MRLLAIDPGPTESAYVLYDTVNGTLMEWAKVHNGLLLAKLEDTMWADELVVEMIASYGMPVGADVFETCTWIGKFEDRWHRYGALRPRRRVFRRDVKLHLCGSARAKDGNVRQAILDRYGDGTDKAAKGTKASPGPLYGLAGDGWAALAVAITDAESGHN